MVWTLGQGGRSVSAAAICPAASVSASLWPGRLLTRPALLVLDEATRALDAANEERIARAIAGLHGRVTVVLITHRLATVARADRVVVLDHGRVVQQGDWPSLRRDPGAVLAGLIGDGQASGCV